MRSPRLFPAWLSACGAFSVLAGCGTAADAAARRLASIRASYPCETNHNVKVIFDSGLSDGACSLTRLAIHQVAQGGAASLGLRPTDTSQIYASTVGQMRFAKLDGTPGVWYWTVMLDVHGQMDGLVINIGQLTDSVTIGWAE